MEINPVISLLFGYAFVSRFVIFRHPEDLVEPNSVRGITHKFKLQNRFLVMKIAVVGHGYAALPLAVKFGKSCKVIGFEINAKRVAELQARQGNMLAAE
jgi:hypothetical protein